MQEGHCIRSGPAGWACGEIEGSAGTTSAARTRHCDPVYTLEYSTYKVSNEPRWLKRDVFLHGQAEGVRRRQIPSCTTIFKQ